MKDTLIRLSTKTLGVISEQTAERCFLMAPVSFHSDNAVISSSSKSMKIIGYSEGWVVSPSSSGTIKIVEQSDVKWRRRL